MSVMLKSPPTLAPVLLLLLLCSCVQEDVEQRPPNILLILADDLGVNDVSGYGGVNAKTPSIDSIADGGIRFTRFYADSTCSPSRAALLTGLSPARTGFLPNGRGISPETITLPKSLQAAGYATHHIGKWHVGDTIESARPHQQGFESSLAFTNQWRVAGKRDANNNIMLSKPSYFNPWLTENGAAEIEFEGHLKGEPYSPNSVHNQLCPSNQIL